MHKINSQYGCVAQKVSFVLFSTCDALSRFNNDACKVKVSRLNFWNWKNKDLEQLKLSPITKGTAADLFTPKNTKTSV